MGKTVTTYLVDGDPKGTRYAFISNKICQMFVVPRSNLDYLDKQKKLQKPAFYILIGEDEMAKPQAYIGETENFKERVKDHDQKKNFWQKALIFVSKDADMTKTDVQYLEYLAVQQALQVNRYNLKENKQTPKEPNLPEYQKDAMVEFFDDIKFLTSFVGIGIFETALTNRLPMFYFTRRGADARGVYDGNGLTVLKGSKLSKEVVPSCHTIERRNAIVKDYAQLDPTGRLVLTSDITFSSPSTAASICGGCSSNGWVDWKNEKGQTLDEIYRKK
ncbi:MAG: GIY-YIG nuclease family protein [Bacteroidales bacterium]|nr:GIY-YIG nuclease family protein [Bacteroidales bacterium]